MEKMWVGRTSAALSSIADDFNSSIRTDSVMYREDIRGSLAHAAMLAECGIIDKSEAEAIEAGLRGILADIESGALAIADDAEDIHMFIESELTRRIGDAGKRLHTARSRNDQVATDTRLYMRTRVENIIGLTVDLIAALHSVAKRHRSAVMPGYTHLQRAQPILFAHQLLAYCEMLRRDVGRLEDARDRMNVSPLGSLALAGTTYPISREMTAAALGFDGYTRNSIDGVADRDFAVELASAFSIIAMHLSRLSEEIILWSSWEFSFIELSDEYTTGSSIMPQKKNSDMAELVRGKTGRVYGDLIALLTMQKGLPLAYNKDMQEDKEALFDAAATVEACLSVFAPMIEAMSVKEQNMRQAAERGFINATDLADYLTKRGMPFRAAYKLVGELVSRCIAEGTVLDKLPLGVLQTYSPLFGEDVYSEISLDTCIKKRISAGSTGSASVAAQLAETSRYIGKMRRKLAK